MSEIITVRDSEIVAAEINTIKEDTRRIMIANAIRIGGKLVEAKSMVPFGEWGKWLEEKVNYSQSTANNMMQLYREYGEDQESLFDNWTKSEAFGKLTYTQHMALLALPFADRAEFAESHDVENMSTRELEKAIRDEVAEANRQRDVALETKERFAQKLDTVNESLAAMEEELDEVKEDLEREKNRADTAGQEAAAYAKQVTKAQQEKERAEKSEKSALELVEKLKKQVSDAKAAEKKAKDALKASKDKPEIPEEIMEKLRAEAEAAAAQQAAAEMEKKLAEAQKRADVAAAQAQEAEEKLKAAQKAVQMANPDLAVFQNLYIQLQETWNRTVGAYQKVKTNDEGAAGNCMKALEAALAKFHSDIAQKE